VALCRIWESQMRMWILLLGARPDTISNEDGDAVEETKEVRMLLGFVGVFLLLGFPSMLPPHNQALRPASGTQRTAASRHCVILKEYNTSKQTAVGGCIDRCQWSVSAACLKDSDSRNVKYSVELSLGTFHM
jgi:hypothetical protein